MIEFSHIEEGIKDNKPDNEIARKVYLSYPTQAFIGKEERQYKIINEISEHFNIPIMNIQVAGSAKTGYSFYKKTQFTNNSSDLDIAIIDSNLFIQYTEWVFKSTNGFNDRSGFKPDNYKQYSKYVSKGIFRPDLMPTGEKRADWDKFFGKLSRENKDLFKSINAGIYMSQTFFEYKQASNIQQYISIKAI